MKKSLLSMILIVAMVVGWWTNVSPTDIFITIGLTAEKDGEIIWGWEADEPESQEYTMVGKYASCGLVFTEDGNIWEYWQEGVRDDVGVIVRLSDNGTPEEDDDEILEIIEDGELRGDESLYWLIGEEK